MADSDADANADSAAKKIDSDHDATSAMKKAMFHARTAQQWAPGFFGLSGSAKIWNFHTQASMLYQFRASRGLPHDDLDHCVGECMKWGTYNLRVGRYRGADVVPQVGYDVSSVFSTSDSAYKSWNDFDFLGGKKKPEDLQ